jgi:NAD(P)-dependent dehydrogenase (short-subunit alcohol dehydrogenase family)
MTTPVPGTGPAGTADPVGPVSPATSPEALAVLADGALAGRTALVTGGGSGIGRATALLLSRLGARVVVVGRTPDSLEETVALDVAAGGAGGISTATCDVREPEQVDALLDTVLDELDRIDVLVNNAGGQFPSAGESLSYKGFRAVTRLNLDATWYLTARVAERSMLPQRYGKIVSITMSPHRGTPGMAHSSAARAAVESLTRTLAAEWGPRGVRLVAITPSIWCSWIMLRCRSPAARRPCTAPHPRGALPTSATASSQWSSRLRTSA